MKGLKYPPYAIMLLLLAVAGTFAGELSSSGARGPTLSPAQMDSDSDMTLPARRLAAQDSSHCLDSGLQSQLKRCLQLEEQPASVVANQAPARAIWAEMNKALMASGVRFHLEWGALLGWYRECAFLPTDHDLDIAVWASDWTPELNDQLVLAAQRVWCPRVRKFMQMLKHPDYPQLVTPIQVILRCMNPDGSQIKEVTRGFDMIDISFMHRPTQRDYLEKHWTSTNELIAAIKREPTPPVQKRVWWLANNDVAEHRNYAPYSLVLGDVFGQISYVPANTAGHLQSSYNKWHEPNRYKGFMRGPRSNRTPGKPDFSAIEHWDEWWEAGKKGRTPVRRVNPPITAHPAN